MTSSPSHKSGESCQDSRPQIFLALFFLHLSAELQPHRETKLPLRVPKRLKRLARADSSRVPARTCSLRESPSISRPAREDPALLAGLPLSTIHAYLPTFFGQRSARTKWRQQVRGMLAAVRRAAILRDGQKIKKHTTGSCVPGATNEKSIQQQSLCDTGLK